MDLHYQGRLVERGFARQEQVSLTDFLANRFGRHYGEAMSDPVRPGEPSPDTVRGSRPVPQFSGRVT